MIEGLTVPQINELTQRLVDLATKAERHRCKVEWHRAAAVQTDREAEAVRVQLAKAVRDSQHEVEVNEVAETCSALPDKSSTPSLPTRKAE